MSTNPFAQGTRRQLVVIWTVLALSVVASATFALLVPFPASPGLRLPLLAVVALMGAGELVAGAVVVASIRRRALATGTLGPATAMTQTIVASALAEGLALFACVGLLVTDDPLFLVAVAACLAVLARWFPSEARWARLGGAGPSGARRTAMIRE